MKINRTFLYILFFIFATVSAWWLGKHQYKQQLNASLQTVDLLDKSLSLSNEDIKRQCQRLQWDWNDLLKNPATMDNASPYTNRIDSAIGLAESTAAYIENIKTALKQKSFNNNGNSYLNNRVGSQFALTDHTSNDLNDSLTQLLARLTKQLPLKKKDLVVGFPIADSNGLKKEIKTWLENDFTKKPTTIAIARLTQIQNRVLRSGYICASMLNENIGCVMKFVYDKFDVITNINASYLMPGETLELTAGLGLFSAENKPLITINGHKQNVDFNGISVYQKKVGNVSGEYTVPITISFKNPNTGKIQFVSKTVSYTVGKK